MPKRDGPSTGMPSLVDPQASLSADIAERVVSCLRRQRQAVTRGCWGRAQTLLGSVDSIQARHQIRRRFGRSFGDKQPHVSVCQSGIVGQATRLGDHPIPDPEVKAVRQGQCRTRKLLLPTIHIDVPHTHTHTHTKYLTQSELCRPLRQPRHLMIRNHRDHQMRIIFGPWAVCSPLNLVWWQPSHRFPGHVHN